MTDKQKIEEVKSNLKPSHEIEIDCAGCGKSGRTTRSPFCTADCRDNFLIRRLK